ncbi:MAG: hypothetical protein JWN14_4164 [Chthonomonadales bacterium]|nr:hypothetical protein [Chthonomonadales bacterium]
MILLQGITGSILGALVLSVLTLLFHRLCFRRALEDGQYVFVFFVTVPVGIVLGAITGVLVACLSAGQTATAGRIAQIGGGFLIVLFLLLGLFVFSGTEKPSLRDRLTATVFWFGPPLLWSGGLLATGFRLVSGLSTSGGGWQGVIKMGARQAARNSKGPRDERATEAVGDP